MRLFQRRAFSIPNAMASQYILSQPSSVNAYNIHWARFSMAAFYMNQICDFLNRLVTKYNTAEGDGGEPKWSPIGNYEFMTIEAVSFGTLL